MSFIKKGEEARKGAMAEDNKGPGTGEKISSFKSGSKYNVRIANHNDFAEWFSHSVFGKFYSCPCTSMSGEKDLYCQAVDMIYKDKDKAKKKNKEDEAEKLRKLAYAIKAKARYLFGFYNLEDGKPMVIDVTKKQAQTFINAIDKFKQNLAQFPFTIEKTGSGQSTQVSITPVIGEGSLTDEETENFKKTEGKEFPDEMYENVLYVKKQEEQAKDLITCGIDVARLGIDVDTINESNESDEGDEIGEDDVPF